MLDTVILHLSCSYSFFLYVRAFLTVHLLGLSQFKTRLTLTIPSLATQLGNDSLAVLLLIDPPKPVVLAVCKK